MRRDQQSGTITQMRGLQVQLLGRPRLELDGQPLTRLMAAKHQALVYYLAGQERPVARNRLASLLWGRLDAAAARGNLRVALSRLRRLLPQTLDIDTHEVGLSPTASVRVDWRELERIARDPAAWPHDQAVEVARSWRGPLLDGFELGDADEFDDWIAASRQRAARSATALRRHLARTCETGGDRDAAVEHLRAWLDIDDADEEAHMALIRLHADCGRRTAAIAQYEACRAALVERLGARPSAECFALYRRIHADAPRPDPADGVAADAAPATVQPLPALAASAAATAVADAAPDAAAGATVRADTRAGDVGFIGRAAELETLRERLLDPQCRWLTIVGPGGVGKTRIAQAAAGRLRDRFAGGTFWFSGRELGDFREAGSGRQLAGSIAGSVGADGARPAGAALLVLDNLETVGDARILVDELLVGLPQATVLATSRVRVGGSREWLLELGGLDLARRTVDDCGSSEAACLLAQCIRRIDPTFEPRQHAPAVERICERVAGLPLALEMAAHGARAVGVDAMAARLDTGIVLADPERRPDDPHRSLDVVLEDSWMLLPEGARAAAARLAVLPDEFDSDLAAAVQVDLGALEILRTHSWLARTAGGCRLAMHPLQRQYLRRQEDAGGLQAQVAGQLAAHLRARIEPVAPFGDVEAGDEPQPGQASGPSGESWGPPAAAAILDLPAIRLATDHAFSAWPAADLCGFIDAVTARLVAQERSVEAVALLERAARNADVPEWRRIGWQLRCAELANQRGETATAARAWRNGLQQLGLGDLEAYAPLSVVPGALRRLAGLRGWPAAEPERGAFSRLVARSLMQFGQHLSFTTRPAPMFLCGALNWLLSVRALGRPERTGSLAVAAYGNMLIGLPAVSRAIAGRCERRGTSSGDARLRLLAAEALAARRIADGQWQGLLPLLDELGRDFRRLRWPRHEMECRSLAAKVAFYQGLLNQARQRFFDLTMLAGTASLQPGHFWGPMGEAEVGLALGTIDNDELRRLLERSRHAMAEIENIDSAYTLRWFGLRARLACRGGDLEALREATMAGAAAGARIPFCGFWAHEGFAGVGEGLIRLRRHERDTGGAVTALGDAWRAFRKPLRAHCRRFPPAISLWHYLHALDAAEDDRLAEAGRHLRASVRCAERQGMRLELARGCELLGALEKDAAWASRATRLYRELGASGEAAGFPHFLAPPPPERLAGT